MSKILVVIDVQNDFVTGSLGSPEARAIVPNVRRLIEEYSQDKENLIVFTRDTHFDDYLETQEGKCLPIKHCIYETEGWEIVDSLRDDVKDAADIIDKRTFGWSGWAYLKNVKINEIAICGLVTDICVVSNALILKSFYPEVPMRVYANACAGTSKEAHDAAILIMRSCQIDVVE